jgi:hypothetical protein
LGDFHIHIFSSIVSPVNTYFNFFEAAENPFDLGVASQHIAPSTPYFPPFFTLLVFVLERANQAFSGLRIQDKYFEGWIILENNWLPLIVLM